MTEADVIQPSASVASTGLGIRYIGAGTQQHCYAYSGVFAATSSPKPALDFTTGSGYIVGDLQLNGAIGADGTINGSFSIIKFNNIEIARIITANSSTDSPGSTTQPLVIPPFTHVTADIDNEGSGGSNFGSITFTGRVYGAD